MNITKQFCIEIVAEIRLSKSPFFAYNGTDLKRFWGARCGLPCDALVGWNRWIGKTIYDDLGCQSKAHDEGIPFCDHRCFHLHIHQLLDSLLKLR